MNMLSLARTFVALLKEHPYISAAAAVVLLGGGTWGYIALTGEATETRYILGSAETSTVVASVSGTGQVAALTQVDLKPKASATIVYVAVKQGQFVKAGQLIASLDASVAQKAVRDAEVNLESARLSLTKLQQPADTLSLIQAENALAQAQANLEKAYDDGFNEVSDTFLDLPSVMSGLQSVLYGTTAGAVGQYNIDAYADMVQNYDEGVLVFKNDAAAKYKAARSAYDATFLAYRSTSRTSDRATIEALINDAYDTTKLVADAVKSANDYLGFVKDRLTEHSRTVPVVLTGHASSLSAYTGDTNSHLVSLLNIKDTFSSTRYTIAEKTESLAALKEGTDALDLQSSQLSIKQRENALLDAKETLADYYVRAPFDGTIATLNARLGDSASTGTSLATLITAQEVAELSLNEVDIAQVKVGAKATLTFDAVEDLAITGSVVEVDAVGTVSQGVVSYTVKVAFDTHDDRVKPGMSVSASIVTDVHQDVLVVQSDAVKSRASGYYVLVFDPAIDAAADDAASGVTSSTAPQEIPVTIGLSDDVNTEIVSGLSPGAQVVTKTVTAAVTSSSNTQAPSILSSLGGGARVPGSGGPR